MNKGTPAMGKEKSDKPLDAIKEGTGNHMSGPNHAGPQTPGGAIAGGAKNSQPYIGGGKSNHMVGPQHADPQQPGVAGHSTGANEKFIKGGSTKMFGYTGSTPAKPA